MSEKELKLRAEEGLIERDALLTGQLQAEGLGNLLNISTGSDSEYPLKKELRNCEFRLPHEVQWAIGDITRETMNDGVEREVFIGFNSGKFTYSRVHLGTETGVGIRKKDLFPDDFDGTVIAAAHTHPIVLERPSLPSNPDICSFIIDLRHVPVMVISGEPSWILVKSEDYYQGEIPVNNDFLYKQFKKDLYNAERRFKRSNPHYYKLEEYESFLASFLNNHGIVLFACKEHVTGLGDGSARITDGVGNITFSAVEPKHEEIFRKVA